LYILLATEYKLWRDRFYCEQEKREGRINEEEGNKKGDKELYISQLFTGIVWRLRDGRGTICKLQLN
jgi:hypothetical protein